MENNLNVNPQPVIEENVQIMDEDDELLDLPEASPAARRRQKIVLFAMVMICIAVLASGTMAFFTAEETAYNVITTGVLSMDLVEETADGQPWPEEGVSGVMPGMQVDKIPYVVNDGGIDFWTRICVTMKVSGGDALSDRYISLNINRDKWTEKDGYYYYKSALKPGEETEPLFTKVSFAQNMPNKYMNARIEIDVHAEAVQSRNNGSSAVTAAGWDDAE